MPPFLEGRRLHSNGSLVPGIIGRFPHHNLPWIACDANRIAVIGYCFGGTAALELGRDGAPVVGVVTFHGGLDSPTPADGKNIKGKVLVLHGADDPFVKPADIAAFQEELRNGNVDWQMVYYADAVHSFTQPQAGTDKSKGNAYNEKAAKRSWEAMKQFFKEIFGEEKKK